MVFDGGKNTISGNITIARNNTITFKGDSTNLISGTITSNNGNSSIKTMGEANTTISGNISTNRGGSNTLILTGATNKIISSSISLNHGPDSRNTNAYNRIILGGNTASIGNETNKTTIGIDFQLASGGGSFEFVGSNTIIANATTNTLNLKTLNISGNFGTKLPYKKTHNIISFNQDGENITNTLNVESIASSYGNTIVGKGIANENGVYASALFDTSNANYPSIKDDFATTFMSEAYTAKGDYTVGTGSGDVISSANVGGNYINVETLTINGNVKTNGGQNYIYANTLTMNGNILSGSDSANSNQNTIIAKNFSASSSKADQRIVAGNGDGGYQSKNVLIISEEAELSNASLAIIAKNAVNTNTDKHNIIKFGGSIKSNQATLAEISVVSVKKSGYTAIEKTKNILSFDGLTQETTLTIGDINKESTITSINDNASGYNYIAKNLTQGSTSSLTLNSSFESNWSCNLSS